LNKPKRTRLREGDWFAVPLDKAGFVLGLAARYKDHQVLGYFFGPLRATLPSLLDTTELKPEQALLIRHCGDASLVRGVWPVLGRQANWERAAWPVPVFWRSNPLLGSQLIRYDDDGITQVSYELYAGDTTSLPEDGLYGDLAMEICLKRVFGLIP
jgi:hypothetical protein